MYILEYKDGVKPEKLSPKAKAIDRISDLEDMIADIEVKAALWAAGRVILSAALFLFVPDGISTNDIED